MAGPVSALSEGPFGLGCAPLGNLFRAISDDEANALLESAWNAGVRWFDTAPHYGLGLSERRLGAFLRHKPREEFVVSTKVGRLLVPNDAGASGLGRDDEGFDVPADFRRVWDFSAAGVARSVSESLVRLGLDRIDIALLHDPTDHLGAAITQGAPTLERLRADGIIGAIGAGTRDLTALDLLISSAELDYVMVAGRYTLLDQEAAPFLFKKCIDAQVGVLNVGVFNSGILATDDPGLQSAFEYAPADASLVARARAIAAACRRHGTSVPAASIHFARSHPAVAAIAIGASSGAELQTDAEFAQTPIPSALWDDLAAEGLIDERAAATVISRERA